MNKNLPALTDGSLSDYLNEIKKFPMLTSEEEFMLAKAWVIMMIERVLID